MKHAEYRRIIKNSDTAVLFIHGILSTPNFFNYFLSEVPDSWSIVNVLLDGHGKGVKDFSSSSMKKWKKQIFDIVSYLAQQNKNIVIVAHSMGTLLATESALMHPDKVKYLMLIDAPLKVHVKATAIRNVFKVATDRLNERDDILMATKLAYSVEPDKRIYLYAGWAPRFIELFKEIGHIRKVIADLNTPCSAYQSKNDELVSLRSCKYLAKNKGIERHVLERSGHMYFDESDKAILLSKFREICKEITSL